MTRPMQLSMYFAAYHVVIYIPLLVGFHRWSNALMYLEGPVLFLYMILTVFFPRLEHQFHSMGGGGDTAYERILFRFLLLALAWAGLGYLVGLGVQRIEKRRGSTQKVA